MRDQILYAFRRTPRMGRCFRFVPLHELPPDVEIQIVTSNDRPPSEELEDPERTINDGDLERLTRLELPAASYTLVTREWGCITVIFEDGSTEDVRPLYRVLAPTASFQGNVTDEEGTFRLVTGAIESIYIPEAGIRLHKNDGQKNFTKNRDLPRKRWTRGPLNV